MLHLFSPKMNIALRVIAAFKERDQAVVRCYNSCQWCGNVDYCWRLDFYHTENYQNRWGLGLLVQHQVYCLQWFQKDASDKGIRHWDICILPIVDFLNHFEKYSNSIHTSRRHPSVSLLRQSTRKLRHGCSAAAAALPLPPPPLAGGDSKSILVNLIIDSCRARCKWRRMRTSQRQCDCIQNEFKMAPQFYCITEPTIASWLVRLNTSFASTCYD